MIMKPIEVPAYVAEKFNQQSAHPSGRKDAVLLSNERIYRLIATALSEISQPAWEVCGRNYHSASSLDPYGLEFVHNVFYVYGEQKGSRDALAIFKSGYLAADYFVWLVSGGACSIDWALFMDMEP